MTVRSIVIRLNQAIHVRVQTSNVFQNEIDKRINMSSSRRRFLKGIGAVALLPVMPAMAMEAAKH